MTLSANPEPTTEWAVMCASKESPFNKYSTREEAEKIVAMFDKKPKPCGPHRVVSRSVGSWVEEGKSDE